MNNLIQFTWITILAMLLSVQTVFAQDIIILKNGDEVKVKVEEVGLDQIRYKNFENLTGPTYTVRKSDVFMIQYESGARDVFSESGQTQPEDQRTTATPPPVQSREYMQAIQTHKKGKRLVGISVPMFFTGAILIGIGAASISASWDYWDPYYGDYDQDYYLWRNGVIMTTIGSAMFVTSIPMFAVGVNRLGNGKAQLRALESGQSQLGITPVLSVQNNGSLYSGIHLKVNF